MLRQSVALGNVASTAAGNNIFPDVLAAFAPRLDMVNALRLAATVVAKVVNASEDSLAME